MRRAEALAVAERAGVHPGRLAELREHSTEAEVLAEAGLARRAAGQHPARLAEAGAGDTVMVSLYGKEYTEARVELVGTRYLTAGGARYDRNSGQLAGQYMGEALTLPELAAKRQLTELRQQLRAVGVETSRADLTADQLTDMLAIVAPKRVPR